MIRKKLKILKTSRSFSFQILFCSYLNDISHRKPRFEVSQHNLSNGNIYTKHLACIIYEIPFFKTIDKLLIPIQSAILFNVTPSVCYLQNANCFLSCCMSFTDSSSNLISGHKPIFLNLSCACQQFGFVSDRG